MYLAWAVLRSRASGDRFLFTTTHLDPASRAIRRSQWRQMVRRVRRIRHSMPVISVGDFNTTKMDPLARTMLPAMRRAGIGDVLNQQYRVNPTRRMRVLTIVGLAIVWFVIAKSISASAVSTVFTSLTLMLYLLVPWTATNLVDFFFVRRGHYAIADLFKVDGIYGAWGRRGLIAYGVGFLLEIPFMVLPDLGGWSYTGFMAKALNDVDIAWIVGLIVSGGVYWVLTRSLDVESEKRAEAISERELVAVT